MLADAIVVLGCPIAPEGRLVGAAQRRAAGALDAYRSGVAPWVVVSGGRRWYGVAEAEAYRAFLLEAELPEERVLAELCSLSTMENAGYVAELFAERGWQRAALVTCDWHQARARWCFQRAGLGCWSFPVSSPRTSPLKRLARSVREQVSMFAERKLRARL